MNIEFRNVSFHYKKPYDIIRDFSHKFESGKISFIRGKNGSGKTTLSKLICGILRAQKGEILIDNQNIKTKRTAQIADDIGYLFQKADMQLFATTVWEELSFVYEIDKKLSLENKRKINEILKEFKLDKLKDSFPLTLSGGEKQRLALATIFIRDVKFLILDEPFSAIDREGETFLAGLITNFVKKGGGAIVISHENLPAPLHADEIVVLGEGI
ncbi:MAG: energy-coupling factor ABC transporter ATP-binding protein [Bacillota bacterium]